MTQFCGSWLFLTISAILMYRPQSTFKISCKHISANINSLFCRIIIVINIAKKSYILFAKIRNDIPCFNFFLNR